MRRILILIFPTILSGCCTFLTIDASTHAYLHDGFYEVKQASLTPDSKLIVLVEGIKAESFRLRPFTVRVDLPISEDGVYVPQSGMTPGWEREAVSRAELLPVAVGSKAILPPYESANHHYKKFVESPTNARTIYPVQHSSPDSLTELFYTEKGPHPRQVVIYPDGRDIKTPWRYPFLVLVPATVAVDAATFPFQLILLYGLRSDEHQAYPRVFKN